MWYAIEVTICPLGRAGRPVAEYKARADAVVESLDELKLLLEKVSNESFSAATTPPPEQPADETPAEQPAE